MKIFKIIDVYLQAILIIVFAVLSLIKYDNTFVAGYFITGSYQFISMLVHEYTHWFTARGSRRRYYHNLTYLLIVAMSLSPVVYITGIVFLPLLFIAPLMAVYYTRLCYQETFIYLKRPLSVLK